MINGKYLSKFNKENKNCHTYDRTKSLMCKILFSLLRKILKAHNCFASTKKNSFNLKYVMRICLLSNQKSDYINFRNPFLILSFSFE